MRIPNLAVLAVVAALASLCAPPQAGAGGIRLRFLAAPAEDSVERYDIYRASPPGSEAGYLGSLPALAGDTLAFPDSSAARGIAYGYVVRAVGAGGAESAPSDTAVVALPRLSLPDTVRSEGGVARCPLPAGAHPLAGRAALRLSLADTARIRLRHDTTAGTLIFLPASGRADTVVVVARAAYHGKFFDADTLVVLVAAAAAPASARTAAAGGALRLVRAAGKGWTVAGLPPGGRVEAYAPSGKALAPRARGAQPRLLLARDGAGRVLGRFSAPPDP